MGSLQVLEEMYKDRGFHVLGFYSNDYGRQGGSKSDIEGVVARFGVTYTQFEIAPMKNSDSARPVFQWLAAQPPPGPSQLLLPRWNFHKYLISRTGRLVGHWDTPVNPGNPRTDAEKSAMVAAIESELAK